MKLGFITQLQFVKRRNDVMAQKLLIEYQLLRTRAELEGLMAKYTEIEKTLKSKSDELKSKMQLAIKEGNDAIGALDPKKKDDGEMVAGGVAPIYVFPAELIVHCSLPHKAPSTLRSESLRARGKNALADFSDTEAFLRIYGNYFLENFPAVLGREQDSIERLVSYINKDLRILALPEYIFWPTATTNKVRDFFNSVTSKEYWLEAKKLEVRFLARIKMIDEDLATLVDLTQRLSRLDLPNLG